MLANPLKESSLKVRWMRGNLTNWSGISSHGEPLFALYMERTMEAY
jgi:ribosomal protein S2